MKFSSSLLVGLLACLSILPASAAGSGETLGQESSTAYAQLLGGSFTTVRADPSLLMRHVHTPETVYSFKKIETGTRNPALWLKNNAEYVLRDGNVDNAVSLLQYSMESLKREHARYEKRVRLILLLLEQGQDAEAKVYYDELLSALGAHDSSLWAATGSEHITFELPLFFDYFYPEKVNPYLDYYVSGASSPFNTIYSEGVGYEQSLIQISTSLGKSDPLLRMAYGWYRLGEFEKSLPLFKKNLEKDFTGSGLEESIAMLALNAQIYVNRGTGNFVDSQSLLEKLQKQFPSSSRLTLASGMLALEKGEYEQGRILLMKGLTEFADEPAQRTLTSDRYVAEVLLMKSWLQEGDLYSRKGQVVSSFVLDLLGRNVEAQLRYNALYGSRGMDPTFEDMYLSEILSQDNMYFMNDILPSSPFQNASILRQHRYLIKTPEEKLYSLIASRISGTKDVEFAKEILRASDPLLQRVFVTYNENVSLISFGKNEYKDMLTREPLNVKLMVAMGQRTNFSLNDLGLLINGQLFKDSSITEVVKALGYVSLSRGPQEYLNVSYRTMVLEKYLSYNSPKSLEVAKKFLEVLKNDEYTMSQILGVLYEAGEKEQLEQTLNTMMRESPPTSYNYDVYAKFLNMLGRESEIPELIHTACTTINYDLSQECIWQVYYYSEYKPTKENIMFLTTLAKDQDYTQNVIVYATARMYTHFGYANEAREILETIPVMDAKLKMLYADVLLYLGEKEHAGALYKEVYTAQASDIASYWDQASIAMRMPLLSGGGTIYMRIKVMELLGRLPSSIRIADVGATALRSEAIKIAILSKVYEHEVQANFKRFKELHPQGTTAYFSDVPVDAWYAPYVVYAKEKGIINGYPDHTFRPGSKVISADMISLFFKLHFPSVEFVPEEGITTTQRYQSYFADHGIYLYSYSDDSTVNKDQLWDIMWSCLTSLTN